MKKVILGIIILLLIACSATKEEAVNYERWTEEKVNEWFTDIGWLVGTNFNPSTAINQLEMWQADTFDPETIDQELLWASEIGFNIVRVFLHDMIVKLRAMNSFL